MSYEKLIADPRFQAAERRLFDSVVGSLTSLDGNTNLPIPRFSYHMALHETAMALIGLIIYDRLVIIDVVEQTPHFVGARSDDIALASEAVKLSYVLFHACQESVDTDTGITDYEAFKQKFKLGFETKIRLSIDSPETASRETRVYADILRHSENYVERLVTAIIGFAQNENPMDRPVWELQYASQLRNLAEWLSTLEDLKEAVAGYENAKRIALGNPRLGPSGEGTIPL